MNVWTYWAGPMPDWIKTCLSSIERCCKPNCNFHLLTPDNLAEKVPSLDDLLDPRWKDLPPGTGTDCLRAALLFAYGGLWMDADTVCVADPSNLIRNRHNPEQFLYSVWTKEPRRAIAGYVYSPKGHPAADYWLNSCNIALSLCPSIGWGYLGERTLTPIIDSAKVDTTWQIPRETFMPIDVDCHADRYFQRSGWQDFMTQNTIAFGLNHSWMEHNYPAVMASNEQSRRMIRRLLQDAKQAG